MAERAAVMEDRAQQTVITRTEQLQAAVAKYGSGSQQATDAANKLAIAQKAQGIASQRAELMQEVYNERLAEFAINIIPSAIMIVGSFIQIFSELRAAQIETAAVTTITGDQLAVEQVAAELAGHAAGEAAVEMHELQAAEMGAGAGALEAAGGMTEMAGAETAAGTGARFMGISIRGALIATGIGAIIVGITVALEAFAKNWWGVRDAVMGFAAGVRQALPELTFLWDTLAKVGDFITKVFGGDIPKATGEAGAAITDLGDIGTKEADAMTKAAQKAGEAWAAMIKDFQVGPDATHKDWKEQFKMLKDLGFDKSGIHKIKIGLDMETDEQTLIGKLQKSLAFITKFKLPPKDVRKWANNMIDDLNSAISQHPELEPVLGPIRDLIRNNKKSPQLGQMVLDQMKNNPVVAQSLIDLGIGIDPAFEKAATDAATKFKTQWAQQFKDTRLFGDVTTDPAWAKALGLDTPAGTTDPKTDGTQKGVDFGTRFVAGLKTTAAVLTAGLDAWITSGFATMDTLMKGLGAGDADYFVIGWLEFKEHLQMFQQWITDAWVAAQPTVQGIGAGLAAYFGIGWAQYKQIADVVTKWWADVQTTLGPAFQGYGAGMAAYWAAGWQAFKDMGNTLNQWIAEAQSVTIPTIQGLGSGAAAYFSIGWQALKTFGSDVGKWINDQLLTDKVFTDLLETGKKIGGQIVAGIQQFVANLGPWVMGLFGGGGGGGDTTITTPTDKNKDKKKGNWWDFLDPSTWFKTAEGGGPSDKKGGVSFSGNLWDVIAQNKPKKGGPIGGGGGAMFDFASVEKAAQKLQTGLANLANQGANSLRILASASSKAMTGLKNNLSVGEVAAQAIQTGLANLANQGNNSLQILGKASSKAMNGVKNNLKVGEVASQHLQTGLANLANEGSNSLTGLAKASSKAMNGVKNNLKVGEVAAQHLQTGLANLDNQGSNALQQLAKASSKAMNGLKNNIQVGITAAHNLTSALKQIPTNINVHVNVKADKIPQAGGGIWSSSFAEGGLISAQHGQIGTVHGPTHMGPFLLGDNAGGSETYAFVPNNNPYPTLERLFRMFVKQPVTKSSGPSQTIAIKYLQPINIIIGQQVIHQEVEIALGKAVRNF